MINDIYRCQYLSPEKCAYFDDLSLTERRQLALQRQLQKMQPVEVVRHWHCIERNYNYSGTKLCPKCHLSIHSREARAE